MFWKVYILLLLLLLLLLLTLLLLKFYRNAVVQSLCLIKQWL